jgi:hypothetical protein
MPLKGVTLAARYYPEIALRPVSDIDLLVRRHQLNGCLRALRQVGFSPSPGHGRALNFKVLYNLELRYLKQDGLCVELHTGLARLPAYNAALSITRIWERAEPIQVGGWPARYLSPVDELRYLSLHYAVPHRAERMVWLVDIAELIRARAAEWDWEAFVGETVALGLAAPLAVALGRARELLGLDIPAEVTAGLTAAAATPRERRTWQAAHAPLSDAGRFGGHLRALRGPVEQLAFIGGAATVAARKAHRRVSRWGRR